METFVAFTQSRNHGLVKSDYADALKTLALTQAVDLSVVTGEMVRLS
jgi:hypothetical protein